MVSKKVGIGDRLVGEGEPCFIIAEAGVNHNGDVGLAKKLIDAAREVGADAVKFQTFKAEEVATGLANKALYQKETTGAEESQLDMLKRLELTENNFTELSNYAQNKGLIFLATPFDRRSVDLLEKLDVPAFKIASGEITNVPLLRHIARKKKPVILSTGMATLNEIKESLEIIRQEKPADIILLHCVSCYPAQIADMNLRAIQTLKLTFGLPVGLSDHTQSAVAVPVAALVSGACVIEKHFTMDKKLPGPDHRASLEPEELSQMVQAIRDVEKALGDGVKKPTPEEKENRKVARRSIVAKVDIPRGTLIKEDMLDVKRPGDGIEPKYLTTVIGRRVRKNIGRGEMVDWDGIEDE